MSRPVGPGTRRIELMKIAVRRNQTYCKVLYAKTGFGILKQNGRGRVPGPVNDVGITGLSENLGLDNGIEEHYRDPLQMSDLASNYSRISTNGHLATTVIFLADNPYIDSCLNLSITATFVYPQSGCCDLLWRGPTARQFSVEWNCQKLSN